MSVRHPAWGSPAADWENMTDYKREFAFTNPRVIGAEVQTTPTTARKLA